MRNLSRAWEGWRVHPKALRFLCLQRQRERVQFNKAGACLKRVPSSWVLHCALETVHPLEGILFLCSVWGSVGVKEVNEFVRTPTGELCSQTATEALSPYSFLIVSATSFFNMCFLLSLQWRSRCFVMQQHGPLVQHPPEETSATAYSGICQSKPPSASIHLNSRSVSGLAVLQTASSESCMRARGEVNTSEIPDHHHIITMMILFIL